MTDTFTRRFVVHAEDGSVVKTAFRDAMRPSIDMKGETRAKLERFLAPIIPAAGELAIMVGGEVPARLVMAIIPAVDEVLVPSASAWGHGCLTASAPRPDDVREALATTERNVTDIGSNAFTAHISQTCNLAAWLDWGAAFAQRHRLRLQVITHPGMTVPASFCARAVVLGRERLTCLLDGRTLAYRALKIAPVVMDAALIQQAREAVADAYFALDARTMEPILRDMSPADAAVLRAVMRAAWDIGHSDA